MVWKRLSEKGKDQNEKKEEGKNMMRVFCIASLLG